MRNKYKGFTLAELLIAIILMTTVGLIVGLVFNLAIDGRRLIERESAIQAQMRLGMQNVNNAVEKASAIFVVDESKYTAPSSDAVGDQSTFVGKPEWNYIGLSDDGTKLMNHVFDRNTGKWVSTVIGERGKSDVDMELTFETVSEDEQNGSGNSNTSTTDNRLLKYNLGGKLSGSNNKMEFDTAVMGLNTKQIFSKVANGKKGIAIAYRNDDIVGRLQSDVAVSLIFDVSGSMNDGMNGYERDVSKHRISLLKNAASSLVDDLATIPNMYVNLVSFNVTAKYINNNSGFTQLTSENVENVKNDINSMVARGATNPGDGLRYAAVALSQKQARIKYVLLLTDGLPTSVTLTNQDGQKGRSLYYYWQDDSKTVDNVSYAKRRADGSPDYSHTESNASPDVSANLGSTYGTFVNRVVVENGKRVGTGNDAAVSYMRSVASQPYMKGINNVVIIGFSGIPAEIRRGKELRDAVIAGGGQYGVTSEERPAANIDQLREVFKNFADSIRKRVWFLEGP